ncbi:uncharacterized protein LOC144477430 [Augochlora pura]
MEVTSFASATRIVTAVNRITALRPLRDSDEKFWSFLNHSYKAIMFFSVAIALYMLYLHEIINEEREIGHLVYFCLKVVNYLCFLFIHVLSGCHMKDILKLHQAIADFEEEITKLGIVIDNRVIFLWIMATYGVTCLNILLLYGLCGYWVWNVNFMMQQILFIYIANIGAQVHLDYLTYVCWLKCRFKQTNDLLKKFFLADGRQVNTLDTSDETSNTETNEKNVKKHLNKWTPEYFVRRTQVIPFEAMPRVKHELQAVKRVHMLHKIRCIHLHLCRIMKTVNCTFDSQIGLHSFVAIINLVAILYFVYTAFKESDINAFVVGTALIKVIDSLYVWMKIVVVSHVCENTVKETRKAVQIIHQSAISDIDTDLKDEILQFSLQLSLHHIGSTQFDFFSLNFNFVRQCISSITTYLVILIQWTQAVDPDDSPLSSNTTDAAHE